MPVASQEKSTSKRSLTFACVARIWGKRKEKCETLTHRLRARRMYMEEFMQRPVDRHTYYVAWKSMAPRKTSVAAAKPIIDRPLTRTIMEMYCPLNGQKLLRIGTNQKVEHVFWCKRTDTAYSVPREQSIGLDVMPNSLEQRKPSESRPDRCRSRQERVNFNPLMTTSSVVSVARVCVTLRSAGRGPARGEIAQVISRR